MKMWLLLALAMLSACTLSESDARTIAADCVDGEQYLGEGYYNENTKTWWFDLEFKKEGCSPACVVYENKTAEINWRCTGLLPE